MRSGYYEGVEERSCCEDTVARLTGRCTDFAGKREVYSQHVR